MKALSQKTSEIGLESRVWDYLEEHRNSRKSIVIIDKFASKDVKDGMMASYLMLRFVDDVVDFDGATPTQKDGLLEAIQQEMLGIPSDIQYSQGLSERTMNLIEDFKGFYSSGEYEEKLVNEFFLGMRKDLKLDDNPNYLFTGDELNEYYDQIQAGPTIMGMISAGVDIRDGQDGSEADNGQYISFDEFNDAVYNVSIGIMLIKGMRGKELIEDARIGEYGRVYVSKEELIDAGIYTGDDRTSRQAFIDIIKNGAQDPADAQKLKKIVRGRVKRAHQYFKAAEDTLLRLDERGGYGEVKKFFGAYGFGAKVWAKNLAKYDFNPLDPDSEGGYFDLEMNKLEKVRLYLGLKYGLGKRSMEHKILDWDFMCQEPVKVALPGYAQVSD